MTTPNYFKKETDRMTYGLYNEDDGVSFTGFAKNESWNIENVNYFLNPDGEKNADFDFMVGNIRKFNIKALGIYLDIDGTPALQTALAPVLAFFITP